MRRNWLVYAMVFLLLFSSTSYAHAEGKFVNENEVEAMIISEALMQQNHKTLNRSGESSQWTSSVRNSALLRAPNPAEHKSNNYPLAPKADISEAKVAPEAMPEHDPIDWEFYESITGPEIAPYKLLHFNEELEEVEYLYPTISLEEFLEEAEPIVYSVFNAPWRGQEEELKELLEDLAERYDYVLFLMVDADSLPKESLSRYLVRELPLFLIFQEGKIMSQVEGYHSSFSSAIEQSLVDILES